MKATIPIGVPPGLRVLQIERQPDGSDTIYETKGDGHWKFWLHRSLSDRILGTYLKLHDNGKIERITVRANEGDQVDLVKPADL